MKRAICFLFIISVFVLSSCGAGASIPLGTIKSSNLPAAVLSGDVCSYTEKITYYIDGAPENYSISYELSDKAGAGYNVIETVGDYTMCAANGEIYICDGGEWYTVIFTNNSTSYYKFISGYLTSDCQLDAAKFYQSSASVSGDVTTVVYTAEITPQFASEIYTFSLSENDTLYATYNLDRDNKIIDVMYEAVSQSGERTPLIKREYTYSSDRANIGDYLPIDREKTRTVTVVNGDSTATYTVPQGVRVSPESGTVQSLYSLGAEEPYSAASYDNLTDDFTLYVTENKQ